jgi:lipopolysaccharide transport system ATP-binding protein
MQPIIRVENLSKQYRIGTRQAAYDTLRESLVGAIRAPLLRFRNPQSAIRDPQSATRNPQSDHIWALKDVSFEVMPGEVVGIIGRNGAGKSTLLKILSRITEPTSGGIDLHGRVGSLLEVGTGFHPELTGRENIYLNGAILGMKRAEIERKFDEIVSFAEIEKFLDTPVKHYSSGMYVRLAFAVAAHLEPDILVIDEVLAVGDAAFQKKCLGRMKGMSTEGRTVLFVSHNMTALRSLCERAVWLSDGAVSDDGDAKNVISSYLETVSGSVLVQKWHDPQSAPGDNRLRLRSVRVVGENGASTSTLTVSTPLRMEFEFWNYVPNALLQLSVVLYDLAGVCVLNSRSQPKTYPSGLIREVCHVSGDFLNDETYRVRIILIGDGRSCLVDEENAAMFEVHDIERDVEWYGKWIGVVRPEFKWTTEFAEISPARGAN